MASCYCTGACRILGYCPAQSSLPPRVPLERGHAAPAVLTEEDVRRIIREETGARVPPTETCKVCRGVGTGYGADCLKPCCGCNGSGKVRVP